MANVIGSGIARTIVDADGDPVSVTGTALDVNIASGSASIDIGDVDMFLDGGVALLGGAGDVAAGVLRVTIADNDPHWGTVGTESDVDGTAHAQLRYIGASLANQTTIASHLNTTQTVLTFAASTTGGEYAEGDGGFLATGVRNDTLASLVSVDHDHAPFQVNADGALYIDGSNSTQPISGTVTANLSATDNAVLDAMVVDLAAIEALLITIDSDTNSTQGYLSNLSGTHYQDDANWTDGSSKHLLVGGLYQSSMQSVTDGDVAPFQVDANGVIKVAHAIAGGADGVTVVSSAGTDVVLGGDVACKKIDIQAQTDNTGLIAVGFTGVDATEATGTGVILYAGDTYSLETGNLNLIYIDSTVSGEGVRYTYFT